ncbi:MAG TPA: peptide MFS transporter [Steroidobacteraceae bacterium]|nr:peptide MFS transporter [Steroidobacteraceae bacterium]
MSTQPVSAASDKPHDRDFLGHPRGLAYLAFTEAWERFSYYGMQTLLVLYMVRELLLPGHIERIAGFGAFRAAIEHLYGGPLSTVALASAIFGLYTGLVYLTPIGGGLLADRLLGKTRAIMLGASLMAAGHFLMAFDVSFLIALLCLLTGVGCFKGNLASQVGALYAAGDLRRADAYQIYYLFISGAVIAAPLVSGTLGELYGWHYGFGAAGVGMLIAIVIYRSGRRWLPAEPAIVRTVSVSRPPLRGDDRKVVLVLIGLLPVLAIGTVGNQEIFNAYMLWVPDHIDMMFFHHRMPTTWLVTLDAIVAIAGLLASMAFWRIWSKRFREPSEIAKISLGFLVSTAAVLSLVAAAVITAAGGKASFGWVLGFEVLNSLGFSNILPVGLALYTRASPKAVAATMVGVYFLHLFACNNLVGWLGGLIERLSGPQFWGLHAALVGAAAILSWLAARLFGHLLAPDDGAPATLARET